MLRKAMDAAEGLLQEQDHQQQGQRHPHDEASRLLYSQQQPSGPLTPLPESTGYGAASQTPRDEYDDDDDEDEEGSLLEDSYADDDWSDSPQHQQHHSGIARRACDSIRNLFMLVANVENLWDSPVPTTGGMDAGNGGGGGGYPIHYRNGGSSAASTMPSSTNVAQLRRRSYLIVLFWFVVLAGGYATERSTFKLLVDRAGPFRLFSVEMVTISHAIMLGSWMVVSNIYQNRQVASNDSNESSRIPLGIPLVDVGCK
jgi:hypothetical protein